MKDAIGYFDKDCLESGCPGRMVMLAILILPVHTHDVSVHLSVLAPVAFISVLQFLSTSRLPPYLNLFLGLILFFDVIVNEIVFSF